MSNLKVGDKVRIIERYLMTNSDDRARFSSIIKENKKNNYFTITEECSNVAGYFRIDNWIDPEGEDNCMFEKGDLELLKIVKDTKIARAFYKNRILDEKEGYLWIKE